MRCGEGGICCGGLPSPKIGRGDGGEGRHHTPLQENNFIRCLHLYIGMGGDFRIATQGFGPVEPAAPYLASSISFFTRAKLCPKVEAVANQCLLVPVRKRC